MVLNNIITVLMKLVATTSYCLGLGYYGLLFTLTQLITTHVSDKPRWPGGSLQTCRGPGQHRGRGGRRRDAAAVRPRNRASRTAEHRGTSRRRAREGGRPGPWRRPGVAQDWQRRQQGGVRHRSAGRDDAASAAPEPAGRDLPAPARVERRTSWSQVILTDCRMT